MRNFIVKTNPLNDLSALFEPWREGAFARLLHHPQAQESSLAMPVEILDSEHEILLHAELPGISKENIQVSYHEHTLTISAEKRLVKSEQPEGQAQEAPAWTVLRNERLHGRIERRFRLPYPLDFEAAQANFAEGVLTLRLPKVERKSARTIAIN